MVNPEGGPREKKDKMYFLQEIEKLAKEAESNGEHELVVILHILMGAIEEDAARELADVCADFAKKSIEKMEHEIDQSKKRPKN